VRLLRDDQLAEPGGQIVNQRAVHIGIIDHRHHAVRFLLARLVFGQAHACIFRVGEPAVWDNQVLVRQAVAQHGIFRRHPAFVTAALYQHHAPGYITRGVNVWGGAAQIIIYHNVAALGTHAGDVQVEGFDVAHPTDRQDDGLGGVRVALPVFGVMEHKSAGGLLHRFDRVDAGDHVDPTGYERILHHLPDQVIFAHQDLW